MKNKHKIKIYDISYLINEELTEDDLYYLLDTKSLLYSLIIGMHRCVGCNKSNDIILHNCRNDNNWFEKIKWTRKQHDKFVDNIIRIYKNLYQYGPIKSRQLAEWWICQYGFRIKN